MTSDAADSEPGEAEAPAADSADDTNNDRNDHDDLADDESVEAEYLQQHRLRLAQERASAIAAGRRKAGMAGAAMAGAMLAMRDVLEGPPKDDMRVEVEASSDPIDLDTDGFGMTVGEVDVEAPPLDRLEPEHHRRGLPHAENKADRSR